MDDLELLRRYASHGDKDAISSLIRKYQKMVFSACLRRIGNAADAEDATQQVFMALMHSAGGINTSVNQWLYRCAANVSACMIRSRKNRVHREQEKARQTKAWCGNGEAERKENVAILMQCLGKLDATDQKVLVDSHVNGVTQQAIASSMGVTQQAVAKRLGKVILCLRHELTSKGIIFSLLAAVLLAVKKTASAAIPEGIKAVLTTAPSASLAAGGAAGAGTAGVVKVGTAAVLVLAAMATYECVEERQSESTSPQVAVVAANTDSASARPVIVGSTVAGGPSYIGGSSSGAYAPIDFGTMQQGSQQVSQSLRQPSFLASSGQTANDDTVARRRFEFSRMAQQAKVGPRNDSSRLDMLLSSSDFLRLSSGSGRLVLSAKTDKPSRLIADASLSGQSSDGIGALSDDTADLSGISSRDASGAGIISDLLADSTSTDASDVLVSGSNSQHTGRRLSFLRYSQILTGNVAQLDGAAASLSDSAVVDAVPMKVAVLSPQRQYSIFRRWGLGAVDDSTMDASIVQLDTTTIPAGTQLAAAGSLGGRLINQGVVVAEGSDSPLYLTGLVSGRGSYTGNVVFTGGFSPGNSPAAVHVDCATLDASNVLTMELAGLTPGSQYDQLLIDNHLTLGGHLNVKLLYGFTPSFGDSFDLFKGDFSGQFSDKTLPMLGNGLRWDTSDLYLGGSIKVVPEPGTLLLLIASGVGMLRRHRPR